MTYFLAELRLGPVLDEEVLEVLLEGEGRPRSSMAASVATIGGWATTAR